ECALFDHLRESHGRELYKYRVPVACDLADASDHAARREYDLALLELIDMFGLCVEAEGHAVGFGLADCLIAVLHQNDAVLIGHTRIPLGSDAVLPLRCGEFLRIDECSLNCVGIILWIKETLGGLALLESWNRPGSGRRRRRVLPRGGRGRRRGRRFGGRRPLLAAASKQEADEDQFRGRRG